ncbi:hypothetical protein [Pseudomonas asiatica]|uniref:hypothetical protein n=1 Tax=Pseudomonas asiatica TaxID=2219225 RepID=UPI0018AA994F|nr:hypothetical protein [Pseudomonas asiatica]MBF8805594.1 hypothetical protein [Pseudomonas asiatica]
MGETSAALSWLNEKDGEEWAWAANYLKSRSSAQLRSKISTLADTDFKYLARSIHALESEAEGVKLIERLRNAIRQRRYRSSKGGKKTCSFTLPRETKATLKTLAKNYGTSETMLIQRLIDAEAQQAQKQKRQEELMTTITRNTNKLAQELSQVRIEETEKQLLHCLKQLARWEICLNEEQPPLAPEDDPAAVAVAENRMKAIREAISASVAYHELMSPRSITGQLQTKLTAE